MEITLLGTGAADGWPNPFCRCASCSWAREAAVVRTPTCLLVDGRLGALGCVDDATRVVAVHLSHHNPPGPELAARLARSGATAPPEGTRLRIAPAARTP